MSKAPFTTKDLYQHLQPLPGAYGAYGSGADVDDAFDQAVSSAGYDLGFADVLPSVTAADPSWVRPVSDIPLTADQALSAMLTTLTPDPASVTGSGTPDAESSAEPGALPGSTTADAGPAQPNPDSVVEAVENSGGVVWAWPIAGSAAHSRRRVRVRFDAPTLPLPSADAVIVDPSPELIEVLAQAGAVAEPGEQVERVEVKVRARFRPVVTVNRGKSAASFAVLDPATSTLVSTGHPTAGKARAAAVAALKAVPAGQLDERDLHVVKVSGREGGLPLVAVRRTRLAQKVTAKVVFCSEKKPGQTRTVGWLFAGTR